MRVAGIPEEVELVTDAAQIRPGVVVWLASCDICPGSPPHRTMVVGLFDGEYDNAVGDPCVGETAWEYAPITPCDCDIFDTNDIRTGHILRVVDVELDAERATVARVRKLVKS
jgi:hypothetical protein